MNAYERSQQLGLTGTDEEIVAALNAITATKIDLSYLMEMLNFRSMLRKTDGAGGQERWQGTLQNLKGALVALGQTAAVEQYETWFSHVTNPRQTHWDASLPAYAAAFRQLEVNFAGAESMPTAEDFAAVAALGGGRPYLALTVEEYAQQRQDAIDAAALASLKTSQQSALAEANDACIHLIADAASPVTQAEVVAAFTERLAIHWTEE